MIDDLRIARPILREVLPDLTLQSQRAVDAIDTSQLSAGWSGGTLDIEDPATGDVIAQVPDYDVAAALAALTTADAAGAEWARTTPRHRSDVLHRVYDNLIAHREQLAMIITREMGKPLTEARGEVQYAADYVRWYAEEAVRPQGNYREAPLGGSTLLTTRGPIGTAMLITPWNFPMAMATRKIAPALAAGCGAVVKPAALTPLTTLYVVQLMREAGVPEGLVQVVTTARSGEFSRTLMADGRIRKVSFTGSTPVGSVLLSQAAEHVVKSSMELGGNAPVLVFADADLDRAVDGVFTAKMRNGGQSCVAANRILVHEDIADEFAAALAQRMSQIQVGNGLIDGVGLGPVINEAAVASFARLVDDATEKGAQVLTGGRRADGTGYFFEPTVLDHVPAEAAISTEEIFGPIAAISRFREQGDAIARANATPFGLAGFVFSESIDRCFTVADALDVGMVGINSGVVSNVAAPFGGTKASGLGREGSGEGLEEYQEVRYYNLARRESA